MPSPINNNNGGAKPLVDPIVLKKLSARVSHYHGPRKNLAYVIEVQTIHRGVALRHGTNNSSQQVTRSFNDFQFLRKTLLSRVGGGNSLRKYTHKCHCKSAGNCPFDVTRAFLERLQFTKWTPFFSVQITEQDLERRQKEMNTFLQILFAILHRMHQTAWHQDCLFLQDILDFLEVEQHFCDQIEKTLSLKKRQMNLEGWKAHTLETFGIGIRS